MAVPAGCKQPVDVRWWHTGFYPRVSPPATHTPDAGAQHRLPNSRVLECKRLSAPGAVRQPFPTPIPSRRLLPASPGPGRLGRGLGAWEEGPQGLSPQVKKGDCWEPLCSQGRDGSEVQPTPLKPRPPWSRTGALSCFPDVHLPMATSHSPTSGPANTCIVHWCLSGGARRGPQTSTVRGHVHPELGHWLRPP